AASNTIRQTGAGLAWNWRVTPWTTWNLGGSYGRNEFLDSDRVDHLTYIRAGITRQFQPQLFGSLYYRRQQNDSNEIGSSYTENAGIATLQMRF
ncbi:MAG TPA: outer membrane beta-barrel protein, partial [Ramlibacter sp.]